MKSTPPSAIAFFNDTNSHAYREDAANDAWSRTMEFFDKALA